MGLDMYLTAKNINSQVKREIGYWRKANQIHGWFVRNVQNGEDDGGVYLVAKSQIHQLLEVCRKVKVCFDEGGKIINGMRGKVDQLLPTFDGFFFGSTEYDEHYFKDICKCIEITDLF